MKNNYMSKKIKLIKESSRDCFKDLMYIKKEFGYKEYYDAVKTVANNVKYKQYFLNQLFPNDINNIISKEYIPLAFNDKELTEKSTELFIVRELLCFISFFSVYKEKLEKFHGARCNFENHLLSGKYELAVDELREISNCFGYSFWYVESQFLLSNYSMNIVEAGSFYQGLKRQCEDYYIKNFVRALRRKTNINENVKDSYEFIRKKEQDFEDKFVDISKQIYFSFSNNQVDEFSDSTICFLLSMATKLNLIDMFLLVDKIILYFVCNSKYSYENKSKIMKEISDKGLPFSCKKTSDLLNSKVDWSDELTKTVYAVKQEMHGDKKQLVKKSIDALVRFPRSWEIILNYTKVEILCNENSQFACPLLNNIIETIKIATIKKGNYELLNKTAGDALRLLMLLSSTALGYGFSNFYHDTFNADISQNIKDVVSSDYYNRNIFLYFGDENIERDFNKAFGVYESNWYHEVQRKENLLYDEITTELLQLKDCEDKLENLHDTFKSENSNLANISDNRCCEQLLHYYIEANKVKKAIGLYIDLQFESKLKVCSFDNNLIDRKCNGSNIRDLYMNIDFCIYAHLTNFRGATGIKVNNQAANSLLAILKMEKVDFPSELQIPAEASEVQKLKYAYLFRHICNEELLTSILTRYSINSKDFNERKRIILNERKALLKYALCLDAKSEQKQIESQIREVEKEIESIGHIGLEDTLISYAKILEDSVRVCDTDIILPFFKNIEGIMHEQNICALNQFSSGEYLLFKDYFIKYKKAYLKSLDHQIGINIRHGFFKNEILIYFLEKDFAFEKFPRKENDITQCISSKRTEFKENPEKEYLVPYMEQIVTFSKKLYNFIDDTLVSMQVKHSSKKTDDVFDIYISDEDISNLAMKLIDCKEPYDFQNKLRMQMTHIIDSKLVLIGAYLERVINEKCIEMIDVCFEAIKDDSNMADKILKLKDGIPIVASEIRKWFHFVREGEELCSIDKYFTRVMKRNHNIKYNLSSDLPEAIKFNQLHCLDLILSNLIMNAEEHSGLDNQQLVIDTRLSIEKNIMIIYFRNNLSSEKETNNILTTMEELEKNITKERQNDKTSKGNGFYHIADSLKDMVGSEWNLRFCKEELPNHFALEFKIDWGKAIV